MVRNSLFQSCFFALCSILVFVFSYIWLETDEGDPLSWGVLLTLTNSSGNANKIIMFKAVFSLLYTWLIAVNRGEQPTRVRKKQKGIRCNETFEFISAVFSGFSVGEAYLPVCAWRILFLFLFPLMTSAHSYGLVQWEQEQQLHTFCQLDKLHLRCCWCTQVAWAGESQLCWFPSTSGPMESPAFDISMEAVPLAQVTCASLCSCGDCFLFRFDMLPGSV